MTLSDKIVDVLSTGVPLHELGTNNWALTSTHAIQAIDTLVNLDVPILGGDVVYIQDDRLEYVGDNWHTEPKAGEGPSAFLSRSAGVSKDYIKRYAEQCEDRACYLLVPQGRKVT